MSQQDPYNPNQQPQQPQYQGQPYQGQQHPYPGQQQPLYGAQAGYPGGPVPPQQKKSWFARHKVISIVGGVFLFFVIVGIAAGGGDDSSSNSSDTVATKPDKANAKPADKTDDKPAAPAKKEKPAPKKLTEAEQFKAFINKNGTGAEKAAAKHITKVQGSDKNNDILDTAEVYTDFTGGMMGPHSGEGKLIASAFADWRDSENGLVTIYDNAGEILSNGNY